MIFPMWGLITPNSTDQTILRRGEDWTVIGANYQALERQLPVSFERNSKAYNKVMHPLEHCLETSWWLKHCQKFFDRSAVLALHELSRAICSHPGETAPILFILIVVLYSPIPLLCLFSFYRKSAQLSLTAKQSSFKFGILRGKSVSAPSHLPTTEVPMVSS